MRAASKASHRDRTHSKALSWQALWAIGQLLRSAVHGGEMDYLDQLEGESLIPKRGD